jgi:hypothetical protein
MNRERLLNEIKKNLIREFKSNSNKLKDVVPYYVLIQNEDHPLLLDLISKTNNKKFYINYYYNEENYYSYGTITIYFGKTEAEACGLEECEDEDWGICLQKDETYFEIDLTWYNHGSTDKNIPRILIRKCTKSEFIDCYSNTNEEFNKWYSELIELQEKDKKYKLKYIDEEIQRLLQEKKNYE